ncbi:hypothetical protein [Nocardioides sambongensis]|uniref:hypothetical protein n=1 Tax=Nocardioides sambongensis TaxID=2589074 RepID=UPI00112A9BDA|nr:hypothetical protein [Nocardioides sambongensis]
MTPISRTLRRYRDGEVTLQQAGSIIRDLIEPVDAAGRPTARTTLLRMAGALPDRDIQGSFLEVEAAYVNHQLTRDEYAAIQRIVAGQELA